MLKRVVIIILLGLFILNSGLLYSAQPLELASLLKEASQNNPQILAAKKRYEAAKARIPQAKSLEDPVIGVIFEKTKGSPFQLQTTMPEDRMLFLTQAIPFFGKLSLKGKIALVESQMFIAEYKQRELEVINAVKNAYYDLFMNSKEIELNKENLTLLDSVTKVSEAKYAVGQMTQEELYKIYLEKARIITGIRNLEQEKRAKETRINSLLSRDPESALGIPELKESLSFNKDIRSLYESTLLNQPELIIFSYAIEKNKYAKSLAKRSFFPDLMAQITERGFSTGTIGPWDLMLAFTVPLWFWTKQRYMVREAIANLEEAEAAYKAMQNRAFAEVKDLATKIEVSRNKIQLYRKDLIPILENSIEVSLSAFSTGKGDFMALLDTQRMLVDTKMDYYKALVEYNMNVADLEHTAGLSFNEKSEVKK